ncbi:MAG TPA: type III pantothenate kinase [Acidimicrobiia bacterium]|nr:type III pantothenate kinase [Acidimicrobiia bacterium]
MKLLLVDVGNSQTVVGVYDGGPPRTWRVSTLATRTADEYKLLLGALLEDAAQGLEGAALSSVVPVATEALRTALRDLVGAEPVVVGPGTRTGMPLHVDNPREVGADRIANALGAIEAYGAPVVTIDFGTATTVDLIGGDGDYRGGAIAPGVLVGVDALVRSTAALRRVDITAPVHAVGRSTVEAIQAGLVYGYAGLVDGLVERILEETGITEAPLVATGGLAETVVVHCRHEIVIDPDLTLRGLRVAWERNR